MLQRQVLRENVPHLLDIDGVSCHHAHNVSKKFDRLHLTTVWQICINNVLEHPHIFSILCRSGTGILWNMFHSWHQLHYAREIHAHPVAFCLWCSPSPFACWMPPHFSTLLYFQRNIGGNTSGFVMKYCLVMAPTQWERQRSAASRRN